MKAKRNAGVVDKLLDAGMIIIGKGNMTEFCGLKSDEKMGWSSYGSQTKSPYRRADLPDDDQPTPGGSSSGSAVSVLAGFCPSAIGTETAGSVVLPASCNGLYGVKLRPGSVPEDGIFTLSESFDAIGVIARTPQDCAALAGVLLEDDERLTKVSQDACPWLELRIGMVGNDWGLYPTSKEKWSSHDVVGPVFSPGAIH
jgi:amidase